jgi:hypothetical protein
MIINGMKVISHNKSSSEPGNLHEEKGNILERERQQTSLIENDLKVTTFWAHVGIQQPPNEYISLCFRVVQRLTFHVLPILDGLDPISFYGWDCHSPSKLNAGLFHMYHHSSRH